MSDQLLNYYNSQLSYLRRQGKMFAEKYPDIAKRISFTGNESQDPTVERLLEGFAFLTAKIQHNIDNSCQNLLDDLLQVICPNSINSAPAFSVIQLTSKSASFIEIPKHTLLTANGCTFRTCYTTQLSPLEISSISWERITSSEHVKNSVKSRLSFELSLSKMKLDFGKSKNLRFYINLEKSYKFRLYELLKCHLAEIVIFDLEKKKSPLHLKKENLKFLGFSPEDALLTHGNQINVLNLITEYFHYPEKFLFFEFSNLDLHEYFFENDKIKMYLYFSIDDALFDRVFNERSLLLNCVPIINLFPVTAEPIKFDHSELEYHLIADQYRPIEELEVFKVEQIKAISQDPTFQKISTSAYFSRKYKDFGSKQHLYWHTRRKNSWELGNFHLPGIEFFLRFSWENLPINKPDLLIMPEVLCTNRILVNNNVFKEFRLLHDAAELIKNIELLQPMSKPFYRHFDVHTELDLLSCISSSLMNAANADGQFGILKKTLGTASLHRSSQTNLIKLGLSQLQIKLINKRNPAENKYSFCQGLLYELTIDDQYFHNQDGYLFAEVLLCFLQNHSALNSFIQLNLMSKQRGFIDSWISSSN